MYCPLCHQALGRLAPGSVGELRCRHCAGRPRFFVQIPDAS